MNNGVFFRNRSPNGFQFAHEQRVDVQLLAHAVHGNEVEMEIEFGEVEGCRRQCASCPVRGLQSFIGESTWSIAPLIEAHERLVAQSLGDPDDGVLLIDESGMPKQGQHSAAVAPQYCGALGKLANCQVGVFLGYASRKGYTLLAGQLFVPEGWFADDQATVRDAVGIPADLTFKTKPELALDLVNFRKELVRGTRALLGLKLSRID